MGEEEKKEGQSSDELAAKIIAAQEKALEALQKTAAAPPAAPEDPAAKFNNTVDSAAKEFGEAVEAGKGGEGIKKFLEVVQSAQAAQQQPQDLEKNPLVSATAKSVVRTVQGEYADLMEDFGDEAKAAVKALSIEDRLDEDKVRAALREVKAQHFDHFVSKAAKAAAEAAQESATVAPPQNTPVSDFGETEETELHGLEQADRAWCVENGVDYKNLAFQTSGAAEKQMKNAPQDQFGGVECLPRPKDGKIKPGSF